MRYVDCLLPAIGIVIRYVEWPLPAIGIVMRCVDWLLPAIGIVMRYVDYTTCCLYRVDLPDDGQQTCSKHVEACY